MYKRFIGIFILSTTFIFPAQANAAEDYLLSVDMNPSLHWQSTDVVPKEAQLKQVRFRIPRNNPDKLIAQIILNEPLAAKRAIPDAKWILGFWIYAPSAFCFNSNSCNYMLEI